MNKSQGACTTGDYLTLMHTTEQINRQKKLKPNKWLIHLGVNDAISETSLEIVRDNLREIVNTLINKYSALPENTQLATPSYSNKKFYYVYNNKYLPVIENLITINNLSKDPDF